jgi:hypothetical protein
MVLRRKLKKVRTMFEYFLCMIGNTAEAWSCYSSRSGSDMLRVWFSCSPFVPSEHDATMTAPLEVCTKDKQRAVERFLVSEGMKWAEIIGSWLMSTDRTVWHNELCTSGSKCLKAAEPVLLMQTGKDVHPHPQTNKTWSALKQRFLETVG